MTGAPIDDILLNINPTGQLVLGGVLALIIYGVALDLRIDDLVEHRRPIAPLAGLLAQLRDPSGGDVGDHHAAEAAARASRLE